MHAHGTPRPGVAENVWLTVVLTYVGRLAGGSMAERGARPQVPALQRRALTRCASLFTPLLPDDYLELINPLWSTRELRGRIERIQRETDDAVTVFIKPGWEWPGHEPGQYLRIGFVVDGVHHWRAYSLTSDPGRPDGLISITPKLVEEGKVTPWLVREAQPGTIVRLGDVEGTFVLPDPLPEQAAVHQRRQRRHADHEHAARPRSPRRAARRRPPALRAHARTTSSSATSCESMAARNDGFRLHEQLHRRARPDRARATSTTCAPTGASARPSSPGPATCSTR